MINYLIYIFLGIIPSIIWLLYYLQKDSNPEPRKKILMIFLGGIIAAILATIIESLILQSILKTSWLSYLSQASIAFLLIAFTEEFLKYIAVKTLIFHDPELDEPVDIIIYLIVASLGFAALENIILFFSERSSISQTILITILRFLGATLLHALCSGLLGLFIVIITIHMKKKWLWSSIGLILISFLHALYNLSIMRTVGYQRLAFPGLLIIILAISLSLGIKKVKKMKSICKI